MKVLMINVVCGIRSTGRICTDLAIALEKQGHQVKIAYGRENVPEEFHKYGVRIGNDLDVKLHGVKARLLDKSGFGSKRVTEKFVEWIKMYNPDVIHLHNLHGYYINVEVLFKYLNTCGKRIIWTLHDCWAYTGHCSYYDYVGCDKWKTHCGHCEQKHEYPESMFIDNSFINYSKKKKLFTSVKNLIITTPSKWLAKEVRKSFLGEKEIRTIYNGIDTEIFKMHANNLREEIGLKDKYVILGAASYWPKRKGLDIFLNLAKYLKEDQVIVLVGLNKEQERNLPSNIISIHAIKDIKKMRDFYCMADLFFNTSSEETMGLTTVEALACGTPVLVFNKTAMPELVDSKCGKIIEYGMSGENIAKAISTMQEQKFEVDACRDQALKYSKDLFIKKFLNLYNEKYE